MVRTLARRFLNAAIGSLALLAAHSSAQTGSTTQTFYEEQGNVRGGPQGVSALGSGAFGDSVDLYTGSLSFRHTDIDLPGNSGLSVSVGRRYSAGRPHILRGSFGDWDLDIPHLRGNFTAQYGWVVGTQNGTARCTEFGKPGGAMSGNHQESWGPEHYWAGNFLSVPGGGSQEILRRGAANTAAPSDGHTYPLVTRGNWQLRCLATIANGAGEGFVARSPDGVEYRFDWMASRSLRSMAKGGSYLTRSEVFLLPTLVRDRFGNTVTYAWDAANPWRLNKIESSDGRELTFAYVPSTTRISSITDGARTWSYGYDADGRLSTVTLPDTRQWVFNLSSLTVTNMMLGSDGSCTYPGDYPSLPYAGSLTHPSGAVATYTTVFVQHGRSGAPETCLALEDYKAGTATVARYRPYPANWYTQALQSKVITGAGLTSQTWQYAWSYADVEDPCCIDSKNVYVTDPSGSVTRYAYGTKFNVNEGQQLRVEEGWTPQGALRTTTLRYRAATGPDPIGVSDVQAVDPMTLTHRPQDKQEIVEQGATFTWQANSFDTFARATDVTRAGPGGSRSEVTVYKDHLGLWVLGAVDSVSSGGMVMVDNEYDTSTALLSSTRKFGVLESSFTYHADGNLATKTDNAGHTTQYNNYKLGIPQSVSYPTGASESAVVNDLGLIESVTGAAGYTTSYGYDVAGRLSSIMPPSGWAGTSIELEHVDYAEFGLPAGHWRQTVSRGNARDITYLDALWRPVMRRSFDASDEAATRSVTVTGYDAGGRKNYESYSHRDIAGVAERPPGLHTGFDRIGRVTSTQADSELGLLSTTTEYLAGFLTRETNPRGKATTKGFWALDNPREAQLASIAAPAGVNVAINRDAFGKPLSITRSGAYNGFTASVTRQYVYDADQRLCKTIEPEVGSTVQRYNAAGHIAWRATGLPLPSTTSCDFAQAPEARKISYEYDQLGRLKTTTYGDGSPSITRGYEPDGLLASVASAGTAWAYNYNSLRKLTLERFSYGGSTHDINWTHDSLGNVSGLIYPGSNGPVVTYSPNALGQARNVSGYASNVAYHPGGAVASYVLANGVAHSLTLNTRGLPHVRSETGVLRDKYIYDENGNVTGITDEQENVFNRSMAYDDLDRLIAANAPGVWGSATYNYDPVDNLRTSVIGGRTAVRHYDGTNRLTSISGTESINYAYDLGGNITSRGSQQLVFDLGNRLKQVTGKSSYVYDGEGRRALISYANGTTQLQMYGQGGQLLYAVNTGGTVPATVTGYSCPAGTVLSGSQCLTTTTSTATISSYSCPAGYVQSGSNCTSTSGSSVPASIASYTCPAGATVSGSSCVTTQSQAATISSYSCPAEYTLSGSTCVHTTSSTTAATPSYSCPLGQTLSGSTCSSVSTVPATPVYGCNAGYTLSGTTCTGTVSVPATATPHCNGHGEVQTSDVCPVTKRVFGGPGSDPVISQCQEFAWSLGLTYLAVRSATPANWYTCLIGAVYTYSCPAGQTFIAANKTCQSSATVPAQVTSYSCSAGTLSGSSCSVTTTNQANVSYSCPAGQSLSGSNCTQTNTVTQSATPSYSCPAGYSLAGSTCSTTTTSSAAPVYGCPAGYTLTGTTCGTSTTTTIAATPVYSCPSGGSLSGSTCTVVTATAGTPTFGCPNGGTLSGGNCTNVGGVSSTTAYVYLNGKLIAEHDSASGVLFSHTDSLGSPVARSNPQGGVTARTKFEPFGATAHGFNPNGVNSIGFTGHVNDANTALVYMQQRYYDPIAGRFLSVDPVTTDLSSGAGFGLYTYVDNNPYAKIDPDGRCEKPTGSHISNCSRDGSGGGGVAGVALRQIRLEWSKAAAARDIPGMRDAFDRFVEVTGDDASAQVQMLRVARSSELLRAMADAGRDVDSAVTAAMASAAYSAGMSGMLAGPTAKGARPAAEPVYKTNKEAKAAAEALGFKKIKETVHSGQAVFKRGRDYITRDLDGHNGGAWKMADSVKNLGSRETRAGTFDINLNRIGD
jgi:RHS repeat-associated protein